MLGRPILTQANLASHVASLSQQDAIWAPLYDFQSYGTQGSTQFTFFSSPIGQGTTSAPGASGTKTIADTNMTSAGQLTKGNKFFMTGIECLLFPGENPANGSVALASVGTFTNDVWAIGKGGTLKLTVGSDRTYVQDGPLNMFPPVTRLAVAAAVGVTLDSDSTATSVVEEINYACWSGEPYAITPIMIDDNQGFQVTVNFPVAIAPPSANAPRIGVRLRGYLIRNAQ